MGLAHCNVSHVNNIINKNLLYVMWKDLVATSLVPVNKSSKDGSIGFCVLKISTLLPIVSQAKIWSDLLSQNKFCSRTRHVLQTE